MKPSSKYKRLNAFTLTECLIVMLVGGLIFLGVTEGMGLFMKYTSARMVTMEYEQNMFEELLTLNEILGECDSLNGDNNVAVVFKNGMRTDIKVEEGRLVLSRDLFADTLLKRNGCDMKIIGTKDGQLPQIELTVTVSDDERFEIIYSPKYTARMERQLNIGQTEEEYGYEQ